MGRRRIGRGKRRRGHKQTRRVSATPSELLAIPEHERTPRPPEHELRPSNRGPATGYDTDDKNAWRVDYWQQLAAFIPKRLRHQARVFLIEGLEGLEIERAYALGFVDLHVCNNNPAVVATLKRRYPEITTYGVDAERAALRMKKAGLCIDVASLDFCSCLSAAVLETIYAVRAASSDVSACGYNIMRGRERREFHMDGETGDCLVSRGLRRMFGSAAVHKRFDELSANDRLRLIYLHAAMLFGPTGHPPHEQLLGPKHPEHVRFTDEVEAEESWLEERRRAGRRYSKIYFRRGETIGRRGHVRAFGIYPGLKNLTMAWCVSWTAHEIEGLEEGDYSPTFKRTEASAAPASSAVPDLKTTGFRC